MVADSLVFALGWRPADIYALTIPEILDWKERAAAFFKKS